MRSNTIDYQECSRFPDGKGEHARIRESDVDIASFQIDGKFKA